MPSYIELPIETDPDVLAQDAFDFVQSQWPEWEANDGNLEVVLIQVIAQMAAEGRDMASDVPVSIFRYFGETVMGINPLDPAPATATSTWTMADTAGYTIPEGTFVSIQRTGDEAIAFEVIADVVVAPGSSVTGAGEVELRAVSDGAIGNGLTGPVETVDSLSYVDSIALVGTASGGVDGESEDEYLARLATKLQLMSPRPILPNDFAVLARDIAGVERATAIDGYNPGDETFDNERMVAVAAIDENGAAVSAPVKTSIEAYLEARREVNFVVNVTDPTFNQIDVQWAAHALPLHDAAMVEADVDAALEDYLSPGMWGRLRSVEPVQENNDWRNEPNVRYLEIAEVINRVDGVDYIDSLFLGGGDVKTGTGEESNDTITSTAHGYADGDRIVFQSLVGGAGLSTSVVYFVRDSAANTFKVALTAGGGAMNITTDYSALTANKLGTADLLLDGVAPLPQSGLFDGSVSAE